MRLLAFIVLIWLSFNVLFIALITLAYWRHCRQHAPSLPQPCDEHQQQPPQARAHQHHAQPHRSPAHSMRTPDATVMPSTSLHLTSPSNDYITRRPGLAPAEITSTPRITRARTSPPHSRGTAK